MNWIEHGFSGKVARACPFLTERTVGMVEGIKKEEDQALIYINNQEVKVYCADISKLDLEPGDGLEARRLIFGNPDRPADFLKKQQEAVRQGKLISRPRKFTVKVAV